MLKISEKHLKEVCKIGQGAECCRYIVLGDALECSKGTAVGGLLDRRARKGETTAQGDNCDGHGSPISKPKTRIIDQVSKDTGISPEDLAKYHCVNEFRNKFKALCDGPCEACWDQEDFKEEAVDPYVLVTVTDEEAECINRVKDKLDEACKLSRKAKEIKKNAFEEKDVWFAEVEEKYGIKGNFRFDPETKALRRMEKPDERAAITKVIGILVGLQETTIGPK